MSNKNFFSEQKDGTAVKIKFYEDYIEGYLIKVLMHFGECIIADLFCGPGKNGEKDGSPLTLINKAKQILENKIILARHPEPKIIIIFNDYDKSNIEKLNIELSRITIPAGIKILKPQSNKFSDIVKIISEIKTPIPKFFFLDPFTYSDIQPSDLKQLMELKFSEIMMFLPTFLAYRFKTSKKNPPKLISFLENFTEKGVYDYSDIYDFVYSIQSKLRFELKLKFVQHALIDVGKNKNSLFLLTKNIKGAILFNNIFLRETFNGMALEVSKIKFKEKQPSLPLISKMPTNDFRDCIDFFKKNLMAELSKKKEMFNTEIIEFAVMEGCKPKHADELLRELKKDGKIKLEYVDQTKTKGFYVSEGKCDEKLCKIIYL